MAAKPGERRLQILQTLASMLETPKGEKITTAALPHSVCTFACSLASSSQCSIASIGLLNQSF